MARQQKLKLDIEAQISNLKELQAQLQEIQGGGAKKEKLSKDLSNIINQMGGFSKLGNIPDMKKFTKMFDSIIKQLPDTIKELSSGMKDLINPNLLKAVDDANKAVEKAEAEFKSKVKNLEQTYGSRYDSEGKIQTKITTSLKSFYQTNAGKGMLDAKGNQISWQQLKGIGKGQAGKNSEKYLADLKKTLGFKTTEDLTKFLNSVKSFWEYHNSQAKKFEAEYKSAESALSTTVESKNTAEKNVEDALAKQTEENSKNLNEALADLTKSAADLNKRFNEIVDQRSGNERPGSQGSQDETSQQETEERKKDVDALKKQNKELEKQDSTVKKAIKSFFGYRAILGALRKTVSTAVQSIKQIDEALTQQAMVTGQTREQTYKLLTSYQDLAKQVGATTTEVASVATEYMRQGRSATEALKLTEAAVSAAKVASISTSDSVDYLTTAINGFQLAADDAMAVSDRFAALASSSATSYEELAIGLSKVASQANLAGMSMDFTLGLIAKGIETTRESAESIGTALKTIVARMREMTDYGETLEDGTDINNVEKQLAYVGIALRDAQGNLRSTEDVLNEVGKAWDSFSSNQQAAIAKALAGTR